MVIIWSPIRWKAPPSGRTSAQRRVTSASTALNSPRVSWTRSRNDSRSGTMANVLLGVTGSVAAIYTRELFQELRAAGYQVKVVATAASLYFFDPPELGPVQGRRNPDIVVLDEDEWPGDRYQRGDPVLHIELRRWADLLLIAPLDAHTLAKFALGLADNTLTCIWRAWDRTRPIVLAPAM